MAIRIRFHDYLQQVHNFHRLFPLILRRNILPGEDVYFDISKVKFVSPYGLLGLLLIGKNIFSKSQKEIQLFGKDIKIIQYLERMDFFKIGCEWFRRPKIMDYEENRFLRNPRTSSLLEIQVVGENEHIGPDDVDDIVTKFRSRGTLILDTFQDRLNVNQFVNVLSELCTNVYSHSRSEGYVAIQRYRHTWEDEYEIVKLAVFDYGIGIKRSLEQKHNLFFEYDVEYLQKALELGVSGAGDRGFGLAAIRKLIDKASGYLWINSGQSALFVNAGYMGKSYKIVNLPYFPGTRVAVMLTSKKVEFALDKEEKEDYIFYRV